MEKTIKDVKERAENVKKAIFQAIRDFEVANTEVEIKVSVKLNYYAKNNEATHDVDCTITIK